MPVPILDVSSQLPFDDLLAVIFLRESPSKPAVTLEQIIEQLGLNRSQVCIPQQVHSAVVHAANRGGVYRSTDGLVTSDHHLILSLQVADCIPLFLVDPVNKVLGLIHAGWQGAAGGIVPKAIEVMLEAGGDPASISAVIGPSIRQENFEVGPEVAERFPRRFSHAGKGDRFQLDLPGFTSWQLERAGLSKNNVIDLGLDSFSDPQRFHSFRRDGDKAGRMRAFLGWTR